MANNYFQFKQFTIEQQNCAMKVCTDACLFGAILADKIYREKNKVRKLLDIGTGTGLLSLQVAQKNSISIDAVEIDQDSFEQAQQNLNNSPWSERVSIFNRYNQNLSEKLNSKNILTPLIQKYATNNGHMFYLVCRNKTEAIQLINYLRDNGIYAVSHYISLHSSKYFKKFHDGRKLQNSDNFTNCLVRLPFFYQLTNYEIDFISQKIINFFY